MKIVSAFLLSLLLSGMVGIAAVHATAPASLAIPAWVTHIPRHCYVGISRPCPSIETARHQALDSGISQVLQAMGADYHLIHRSLLSGNASYAHHALYEHLTYTSRWFIRSIQQSIKRSVIHQNRGNYICFLLLEVPPTTMDKLRRLSIGAKLSAHIITTHHDRLIIEVAEHHGVRVKITDYDLTITTRNHHAGIITLFAWKVPQRTSTMYHGAIPHPVCLNDSTQRVSIPNPSSRKDVSAYILGSQTTLHLLLQGSDELGRAVEVGVTIP
jgi:hypothetical protein